MNASPTFKQAHVPSLAKLARDEEGFLLNADDWSPQFIADLATEVDVQITPQHLQIVSFIRHYYEQHGKVPEARTLLKQMKQWWGEQKATRRYLYELFPRGYGQQACKIAGMTKPRKLMLDV